MLCELKLNLCQHSQFCIIRNAKTCVDRGNDVTCVCADGWSGTNCAVNNDDCIDHKCENNGKCIDKVNGYECKCEKGFSGLYCEGIMYVWFSGLIVESSLSGHKVNCSLSKVR